MNIMKILKNEEMLDGYTWVNWLPFDTRSPTTAIFTTWNFQQLCRDFDVIWAVLDDLHTTLARVIRGPRVAIQTVTLVTGMTGFYAFHHRHVTAGLKTSRNVLVNDW